MALYRIPFDAGDVNVVQNTTLEGVVYRLGFWYNQRENCYYLSVGDASVTDGSWIKSSIKIHTNKPLLRRWSGAAQVTGSVWPPGELIAFSTVVGDDSIAGLGDLGARVVLYYATSDDAFLAGA
jgi:hypothetical protein